MDAMKPAGNASTAANSSESSDEMRREVIFLKNRVQVLEKDLMNADVELKATNLSLKEKNNDQVVRSKLMPAPMAVSVEFILSFSDEAIGRDE